MSETRDYLLLVAGWDAIQAFPEAAKRLTAIAYSVANIETRLYQVEMMARGSLYDAEYGADERCSRFAKRLDEIANTCIHWRYPQYPILIDPSSDLVSRTLVLQIIREWWGNADDGSGASQQLINSIQQMPGSPL